MRTATQVDPAASFQLRLEQLQSKLPDEEKAVRNLSSEIGSAKERIQSLREVFTAEAREWLGGKAIDYEAVSPLLSLFTFCANGTARAKSDLQAQINKLELDALPGVKQSLSADLAAFNPFGDAREMLVDAGVSRNLCKLVDFQAYKNNHGNITLVEEESH